MDLFYFESISGAKGIILEKKKYNSDYKPLVGIGAKWSWN